MSGLGLSKAPLIARNSALNAGTSMLLLAVGLVFIPLMIRSFGMELYGVLTITWMLLGQLGWLNAGLGRASTRFVARDLAVGRAAEAGLWVWTAAGVQVAIGAVGAGLVWALAPQLVDLLSVRPENYDLVVFALRVFGLVLPLELAASSVRGVLEATQRFGTLNALGVVEAVWTYTTYAVGIYLGGSLEAVVYGLAAYKALSLGLLYVLAARALPSFRGAATLAAVASGYRGRLAELLRYGGWVAASQGAGPMLLYWDRWVVSALLGAAVLPLYTVPFSVLQRLGFLPGSVTSTLFPAFTDLHARQEWGRIDEYFVRSHKYLMILLLPILLTVFLWGGEVLTLWIGADFAAEATLPLQILTLGFVIALLAPLSNSLLEGAGRPDVMPKIYALELPLNLLLVYVLTARFGIVGAAWSFTLRAALETGAVWAVVYRVFPISWAKITGECLRPMAAAVAGMGFGAGLIASGYFAPALERVGFVLLLAAYGLYVFRVAVDRRDVELVGSLLRRGHATQA